MSDTIEITIVDEAPYRTVGQRRSVYENQEAYSSYLDVDEVLIASGVTPSYPVPFFMDKRYDRLPDGIVENIRAVDGRVVGDLKLRTDSQHLAEKVSQITFSPGYSHQDYDVEDRDGDVPLLVSKSWTLFDVAGRVVA